MTHLSKTGRARIVAREGVRLRAYPDPWTHGPPWTIGVGHTGGVRPGQRISMRRALQLLSEDVHPIEVVLNRFRVPAGAMFDALVSIGINLGVGIFETSHTIGAALHRRDWDAVSRSILLYDQPPIIVGRRRSEKRQFDRGLRAWRRRQGRGKR